MSEKMENVLNMALDIGEQELVKSKELAAGFDTTTKRWDLIVRFSGDIRFLDHDPEISCTVLSNNFAIINTPEARVDEIAALPEIIYVEKPKPLYFQVIPNRTESCISSVQNQLGLYGAGVLIAILDSGIDYRNDAFWDAAGNTRIAALWDQTVTFAAAPEGFKNGSEYDAEQINEALQAPSAAEGYQIVPTRDFSGHGTHVAGIAAGNFAEDKGRQVGIATKSELLIVKLATAAGHSYATTVELMEGIDYVVRKAQRLQRPLVINLSFGNNYGSHDGTSLLETYINEVAAKEQVVIVIGSGNEGNAGGHTGGRIKTGQTKEIEIGVSEYQFSFPLQIWKSYADIFEIEVVSPAGRSTGIFSDQNEVMKYTFPEEATTLLVYYGTPRPYSLYQEVYIEFLAEAGYVQPGIWTVRMRALRSDIGEYDLWLPIETSLGTSTRFLYPTADTTLTIPSTATGAITVGAYDSSRDAYADFSGRGFTRETRQIKPELVAPGVNILSAAVGGGVTMKSGTSMAAPFVSGSAALLMEWGIVQGHDPYLYGQKVKAYLIRGARQLPGETTPSRRTGYGALCLRKSFPGQ